MTTSSVIIKYVQCMLHITTADMHLLANEYSKENKYTIAKYVHYMFHFMSFILTIGHRLAFL